MEINITTFFSQADPFDYSHSRAEGGDNAGRNTWNAAVRDSQTYSMIDNDEKDAAFRSYVELFGAWDAEEIASWDRGELNALFIQLVSGDLREAGIDDTDDEQWADYRKQCESGQLSGRLFKTDDNQVFYTIGE